MNAVSSTAIFVKAGAPLWNASVATNPDASILAFRDEFRAAVSHRTKINQDDGVSDDEMDHNAALLRLVCKAIVECPPAQTEAGRALKAAAAMHKLTDVFNTDCNDDWSGLGEELAWHVLAEIAGDEYVPTLPEKWEPPRRVAAQTPQGAGS